MLHPDYFIVLLGSPLVERLRMRRRGCKDVTSAQRAEHAEGIRGVELVETSRGWILRDPFDDTLHLDAHPRVSDGLQAARAWFSRDPMNRYVYTRKPRG